MKASSFILLFMYPFFLFSSSEPEASFFKAQLYHGKTLEIRVPSTFKLGFKSGLDTNFEYVPKNETIDDWNEIITVTHAKGYSDLLILISNMNEETRKTSYNSISHEATIKKENEILTGTLITDGGSFFVEGKLRERLDGINEINLTKAIEGINEIWMVQYTIRYLRKKTSKKNKEKIYQKIQSFFDQDVTIMKTP